MTSLSTIRRQIKQSKHIQMLNETSKTRIEMENTNRTEQERSNDEQIEIEQMFREFMKEEMQ